jgi:hypothetical protein
MPASSSAEADELAHRVQTGAPWEIQRELRDFPRAQDLFVQ